MNAKFDIFAVSPQGYEVHISLENEHVYTEALLLLAKLAEDGFKARANNRTDARYNASQSPAEGRSAAQDVCPGAW